MPIGKHPCISKRINLLVIFVAITAANAWGQTFAVLHTFSGTPGDGSYPTATLIRDDAGNLYGTTEAGGKFGSGTVFEIDSAGKETVLFNFHPIVQGSPNSGSYPASRLFRDPDGNLFGTTTQGGDSDCQCGVVFKLDAAGSYSVLHEFHEIDGANPNAGLVSSGGILFGTTAQGGAHNCGGVGCGIVFRITKRGNFRAVYQFTGGDDGQRPGQLTIDNAGNLYVAAGGGGNPSCKSAGCGVILKLDPSFHPTVLYRFAGVADGESPSGQLVRDVHGNIHGTTITGGDTSGDEYGWGEVYTLDTAGHKTVLHAWHGGANGLIPLGGVLDLSGNLYGVTILGGDVSQSTSGYGTIYRITNTGHYEVLYRFTAGADGGFPQGELIADPDGTLYGIAQGGMGNGLVFKFIP